MERGGIALPLFAYKTMHRWVLIGFKAIAIIACAIGPISAGADTSASIFGESYTVTLPTGLGLSDPALPAVPVDEIAQQLSHLNAAGIEDVTDGGPGGMRLNLARSLLFGPDGVRPELAFIFTQRPESHSFVDAKKALRLHVTHRFQELAVTREIVQLDILRRGQTWWRYDAGVSYLLDRSVPSIEICKFEAPDILCIHRFLKLGWWDQRRLDLPTDTTTPPDASLQQLLERPDIAQARAILASISRSSQYRQCCAVIGRN